MDTAFIGGILAGVIAVGYGFWVAWRLWGRS